MASARQTAARKAAAAKKTGPKPGKQPQNYKPGQSGNPSGRPKGVPNKATAKFKTAVALLLDNNGPKFHRWLNEVAEGNAKKKIKPDPKGALEIVYKLAEYAHPKQSRTEITGPNGKDLFEKMTDTDLDARILTLLSGKPAAHDDD